MLGSVRVWVRVRVRVRVRGRGRAEYLQFSVVEALLP